MGRLLLVSLPATGAAIYRCKHCGTHLAYDTDILSRMFRCKHGKAFLVNKLVNVNVGEGKEDRMMTTGLHTVCDIFCVACGSILGWKYLAAFDKSQRYKEGKFILESFKVLGAPTPAGDGDDRVHPWPELLQDAGAASDESEEDEQDATM